MGKIVEYTMTDGQKHSWALENIDDEHLIYEEMSDDSSFIKRDTTKRYVKQGELHECPMTIWLNRAHIKSVIIMDAEAL